MTTSRVGSALLALAILVMAGLARADPLPTFAGTPTCAACHADETATWRGSHHDLAMQEATDRTVLGDFDNATITVHGVTSRFFRKDGAFYVNTDGPDGRLQDYPIAYTFGVTPLQQYLVPFPGGRYQALPLAWDSRPKADGGQRWFHLYPGEHVAPGDELHWTGINQNWNFMCADCHSTNLRRNHDLGTDSYRTTFAEVNVACEACHGPGSAHVAWAEGGTPPPDSIDVGSSGLVVRLDERRDVSWTFRDNEVTAERSAPPADFRTEVETCAPCHSRRAPLGDGYTIGRPLLDSYRLSLLSERLYHADGQIKDEVYVYGSFVQSRMFRAGVTCSDCHDPHSLRLRAEGNAVCHQCHRAEHFDSPAHHFHAADGPGSRCVDCHAPATTYMVVDPRRDHSFRVPRPDLSVELGTPNACTGCHADRPPAWAAAHVAAWYGPARAGSLRFAHELTAARSGVPGARDQVRALAGDADQPAIARATAVEALGRSLDAPALEVIAQALSADDPMLRLAAVGALSAAHPRQRLELAFERLADPIHAVRLEAARILAPVPMDALLPRQQTVLTSAFREYEEAVGALTDRPEGLMTLGNFWRDRGLVERAETAYRDAVRLHPDFAPGYANLADLYRATGREAESAAALRDGLEQAPDNADLVHAYGLLLVRQNRVAEAVEALARAAALDPANARHTYVYAVALGSTDRIEEAISVLEDNHDRHPADRDTLHALVAYNRQLGRHDAALAWAERLAHIDPVGSVPMERGNEPNRTSSPP